MSTAVFYNFYLFNREGACLCYREWNRPRPGVDALQDQRNMFGLLFAMKQLCNGWAPVEEGATALAAEAPDAAWDPDARLRTARPLLRSYTTASYQLHYLETPTGLRFVLTTSVHAGDLTRVLQRIYREAYVECAARNPLYRLGTSVMSDAFRKRLDAIVRSAL
ncbi:hypothetical protein CDCA_CDCA06G1880 [Cyanidium caldarium]|uniref:Trafficking protein particle complex subunit n=1 Tax=Cyanidium caldarium TaxID=2771 RepID=A0AAV9IUU6_CYACA|nr:hypothetical protein CDCA_CDCA06G1880 [Cyanidium caldarium]